MTPTVADFEDASWNPWNIDDSPWDDDSYYGCGVNGCCVDDEWWAGILPPVAFHQDRLVHVAGRGTIHAPCGACLLPGGAPDVRSTDEALRHVAMSVPERHLVTCLECVAARFQGV